MARVDGVNETLLEMQFFTPVRDAIAQHYGASRVQVLKPVPQREAFVGFDQGYVVSAADPSAGGHRLIYDELLRALGAEIREGVTESMLFYLGHFVQYKVVERMVEPTISKATQLSSCPTHYQLPYLRSKLDLRPNKTTGLSQHETLLRLKRIRGADVHYACPMIFDAFAFSSPANLDALRLVDVDTAPPLWTDDDEHYLMFQDEAAEPYWCSDPVRGSGPSAHNWISHAHSHRLSPVAATRFLEETRLAWRRWGSSFGEERRGTWLRPSGFPDALRLYRVTVRPDPNLALPLDWHSEPGKRG